MPIQLKRLHYADINLDNKKLHQDAWKVYVFSDDSDPPGIDLTTRILNFEEPDLSQAFKALRTLLDKANTGLQFQALFDEKQCHKASKIVHDDGRVEDIWRIWASGKIRIYWCYGFERKSILILDICAKRENKLTKAQEAYIVGKMKHFCHCRDVVGKIHMRGA